MAGLTSSDQIFELEPQNDILTKAESHHKDMVYIQVPIQWVITIHVLIKKEIMLYCGQRDKTVIFLPTLYFPESSE